MQEPAAPADHPEPCYLEPPDWIYPDGKKPKHEPDKAPEPESQPPHNALPGNNGPYLDMPMIACRVTPKPPPIKQQLAEALQRLKAKASSLPGLRRQPGGAGRP